MTCFCRIARRWYPQSLPKLLSRPELEDFHAIAEREDFIQAVPIYIGKFDAPAETNSSSASDRGITLVFGWMAAALGAGLGLASALKVKQWRVADTENRHSPGFWSRQRRSILAVTVSVFCFRSQ